MTDDGLDVSSRTFESLQALLLSFADVDEFLQDLAALAADVATGASAGITTRYRGNVLTVASSDERAELLDETQYRNGGGPCLDALDRGVVVESSIWRRRRDGRPIPRGGAELAHGDRPGVGHDHDAAALHVGRGV